VTKKDVDVVSMNKILEEFGDILVWGRGDQRAPHKPLLILYALGAFLSDEEKIKFTDIEKSFKELLKEFGPQRKSYHPEYPFWRLQNDGIWLLENADKCVVRKGHTDAKITQLRKYEVRGYFRPDLISAFKSDKLLLAEVVSTVLDSHFPETLHNEIKDACGISLEFSKVVRKRDPEFREKVLRAYQYRCGVCGFQAQIDGRHLALEAAHIKWHAAGGPDIESNGIAICSLHHKLFDKGAFMFRSNKLLVSESVYGNIHFEDILLKYHGERLETPIREEYMPDKHYLELHEAEVFRNPTRSL
jgi:putative restriction endonuclease